MNKVPYKDRDIGLAKKREYYARNKERHNAKVKEWREKNHDKAREYVRRYKERNRGVLAAKNRQYRAVQKVKQPWSWYYYQIGKRYGITAPQYETMFDEQNGVCLICLHPPKKGKRLAVDHCLIRQD